MWKISGQPFAAEAQQNAADNSAQALSHLTEKVGELRSLLATLRPEHLYTGPRVLGGVPQTAPFEMFVPFNGPCEVCVLAVTNSDAAKASMAVLSRNPNLDTGLYSTGAATITEDGADNWLYVVNLAANRTVTPAMAWFPLESAGKLFAYIGATSATDATYFTLQFRQRINAVGVPVVGYP